jgi:DNA mismatch endonuclease, patch repair protein
VGQFWTPITPLSGSLLHADSHTELRLASIMRANKILGWRRNQKVFGKPDFVFRKERIVIFVDGCFWHGCPKCYVPPKANSTYWKSKVAKNRARDKLVTKTLTGAGWRVIRFWEHSLKSPDWVAKKSLRC